MEALRKISLAVCCAAFAVTCLFLNLFGGIGLMSQQNYAQIGRCLIISVAMLALSLILAFFRKSYTNIGSLFFNIIGTILYIYPIGVLNGIPNSQVPKQSIEVLTSRIYPAISVTVLLALVIFADIFSYERSAMRCKRRHEKEKESSRQLRDDEKII